MSIEKGTLYVVATPIGNLGDIAPRAVAVLADVDVIAAEDTRHSARLLQHIGVHTPCVALHEHNEREMLDQLLGRLRRGESIALISDAGTPLVSDPGFHLVRECGAQGLPVVPIPGPSALIAALSVAGLPTDRFAFEGFLPAKAQARRARLEGLAQDPRTLVFFEAPHRIADTLADLVDILGERRAVLARELTKAYETLLRGSLGELRQRVEQDADQRRGEIVLVVEGAPAAPAAELDPESERILRILLSELPVRQAAALAAQITGAKKNLLYKRALDISGAAAV